MRTEQLSILIGKWKTNYNSNVITINDLIEKEIEGKNLSCNQIMALRNFYQLRINQLKASVNSVLFDEDSQLFSLAANLVPYKEFIKD